jgi:hypothetical protein
MLSCWFALCTQILRPCGVNKRPYEARYNIKNESDIGPRGDILLMTDICEIGGELKALFSVDYDQ